MRVRIAPELDAILRSAYTDIYFDLLRFLNGILRADPSRGIPMTIIPRKPGLRTEFTVSKNGKLYHLGILYWVDFEKETIEVLSVSPIE